MSGHARFRSLVAGLVGLACLAPAPARSAWVAGGVPLSATSGAQGAVGVVDDGDGGAWFEWSNIALAGGPNDGLWLQRRTRAGAVAAGMPALGIRVTSDRSALAFADPVADGANGVWMAWWSPTGEDSGTVRLAHVSGAGDVAPYRSFDDHEAGTRSLLVGAPGGGAFLVWNHAHADSAGMRLVRIAGDGDPVGKWPVWGIAFGGKAGEYPVSIVADSSGGAFVLSARSVADRVDLVVHHVYVSGVASSWPDTGRLVAAGAAQSPNYTMVPSGDGVIVSWMDERNLGSTAGDIFASRIAGDGTFAPGWPATGIPVSVAPEYQVNPVAVPDGAGGAIISWDDGRNEPGGAGYDVYASHLGADGRLAAGWVPGGTALCIAPGWQGIDRVAPDGAGGAIVAWNDWRSGEDDVYAARVDGSGATAAGWPANGLAVSAEPHDQGIGGLCAAERGSAFAIWFDTRAGGEAKTYASIVPPPPTLAPGAAPFVLRAVHPNPSVASASLDVDLVAAASLRVDVLDAAGRRVRTLSAGATWPAGRSTFLWDGRDDDGHAVRSGVYRMRVRGAGHDAARSVAIVR
jgi:hypothetical protein